MSSCKKILIGPNHTCQGKSPEERTDCKYYKKEHLSSECRYFDEGRCLYQEPEKYI